MAGSAVRAALPGVGGAISAGLDPARQEVGHEAAPHTERGGRKHDDPVRTKLTDLVEIAVQRPYRCKDREYVRIARAVDSQDLRGRLSTAAQTDNPWARRQAGYVLWLLDHPELPNTLHVWRTWTTRHPDGSPDRPRWDIAV